MVDCGHGILPDQLFRRDLRAEIARAGTHVAVRQLEPRAGEGIRELFRVLVEAPRDRLVDWVHPHRYVRGGHHGRDPFRRIVGGWCEVLVSYILWPPLPGAGGALCQFPLMAEQHVEIAHVPLDRVRRPGTFQAAGDRVIPLAAAEAADPAKALLFDAGAFRLGTDKGGIAGTMAFAESVSACDECDGLFVVHRHTREGFADVAALRDRIRLAVRSFRVHVNQAHLHGGERILEFSVTGVALVAKPFALVPPVDVFFRLPDFFAPAAEAECLEAH